MEERGFRRFIDVLDEQVRIRSGNVLMTPLSDINSILGQEFMKGEVAGLNMAMRFVEARILDVETEVDELAEELKNEA